MPRGTGKISPGTQSGQGMAKATIAEIRKAILKALPGDGTAVGNMRLREQVAERLDAWVKGVNAKGGFGIWCCDVAFEPSQMQDILQRHS